MKQNNSMKILRDHLTLNLARIKCLSYMISAMLESRQIQISAMARLFPADVQTESSFKRIQRFLKQVTMPAGQVARLLLAILKINSNEKLTLVFDRTNWKFGKEHINFLFLCVVYRGISIPLFHKKLSRKKKRGNSSYRDRIALLRVFLKVFKKKRIACVLGDREFHGMNWIKWLQKERIPYVCRLPENLVNISNENGRFEKAVHIYQEQKKDTQRYLGLCNIGIANTYESRITTFRANKTKNSMMLLHSPDIVDPCSKYRERWQIETTFRALKRGGFNIESTHVTSPKRLKQLISVLSIAFCFAYKAGLLIVKAKGIKLKNHGYKLKSFIRYGLDILLELFRAKDNKCVLKPPIVLSEIFAI